MDNTEYTQWLDRLPLGPWGLTLVSALIAMVVAWLAFQTGAAVIRRAVARSPSASLVTQASRKPASYVLPLLALQFVLRAAPDDLSGIGLARQFTTIVLIGALTWLVVRVVQSSGDAVILSQPHRERLRQPDGAPHPDADQGRHPHGHGPGDADRRVAGPDDHP